ncbi:hypothetical protein G5I_01893 [Acromyrmex echinatior]|uniref:Uncharacterized protein n=1 Tax=Acromyrmex echinatior TaxID=103372 RepID=F4W8V5_ACREC|nr:hypothetical protein G5I_01893 [Acromyrmex echinatior]
MCQLSAGAVQCRRRQFAVEAGWRRYVTPHRATQRHNATCRAKDAATTGVDDAFVSFFPLSLLSIEFTPVDVLRRVSLRKFVRFVVISVTPGVPREHFRGIAHNALRSLLIPRAIEQLRLLRKHFWSLETSYKCEKELAVSFTPDAP